MGPGRALRAAASGFYHQSWRLAVFNTVLAATALAVAYLTFFLSPYFVFLFLVIGPFAAALMYCAVRLAREDELRFRDGLVGLRLHWRRGLMLITVVVLVAWLGAIALRFYGDKQWLLAILVVDVLAVFAAVQLLVWPRAIYERERPLHRIAADAVADFLSRPVATFVFALALLVVNGLGILAGVMPFLTLTVAYSFLAAAHFALPPPEE